VRSFKLRWVTTSAFVKELESIAKLWFWLVFTVSLDQLADSGRDDQIELKVSAPGTQDLMPHTNAKHWFWLLKAPRCLDAFTDSSWVARTIREKDAIWVVQMVSAQR